MDQSHHLLQVAQELMERSVPVPPPFHRTPRICPDLTSWIGSGGVPGPELTRRFGFFTTVRHRCRRSSRFTVLALTIGVAQVLCAGCSCTVDAGVRVCDRVVRMAYLRLFE